MALKTLIIVDSKMKSPYQGYEIVNTHFNILGVHESCTVEIHKYNIHVQSTHYTVKLLLKVNIKKGNSAITFFGVEKS